MSRVKIYILKDVPFVTGPVACKNFRKKKIVSIDAENEPVEDNRYSENQPKMLSDTLYKHYTTLCKSTVIACALQAKFCLRLDLIPAIAPQA